MLSPLRFCLALAVAAPLPGCATSSQIPDPLPPQHVASAAQSNSDGADPPDGAEHIAGSSTVAAQPEFVHPTPTPSGDAATSESEAPPSSVEPSGGETEPNLAALPPDTRVLHIGDSFAGALGYELNRLLAEHQVRGFLKYEKSTYIPTWAWSKELPSLLSRYRPDLVLITLGGNELQIPDPEQRAETVQRLVKRFGDVPCVWIGIPVWEGADPKLMDVIERNVSPCLFYDSAKEIPHMARAGDGIHPSKSARTRWAEVFVAWLRAQVAPSSQRWRWRSEVQSK